MCRNWHLWQPGTVDLICNKANGVFMYAREVLKQLNDDPFLDLESLPFGLAELYMTRYVKTFPHGSLKQFQSHSEPMLSMLVASRGPLPIDVVRGAGVDSSTKVDKDFNAERRRHLEFVQTMCVGSLVDVGLLQFSHKSFSDWLEDEEENEDYCVDREDGERLLAEWCWSVLNVNGSGKEEKKVKKKRRRRRKRAEEEEQKEDGLAETTKSYTLTHGVAH